jgi:plastocyanin
VTARGARRTVLALTVTATVGVAGIVGVATAAQQNSKPAVRSLSASGTTLAFSKKTLAAPKGRVTLVLSNKSPLQHNVSIKGNGLAAKQGKVVGKNGVSRVTATLRPGRYTYFCAVDGHAAAGMKGTLRVTR